MKTKFRLTLIAIVVVLLVTAMVVPQASTYSGPIGNRVLQRFMDVEVGRAPARPNSPQLSSGVMYTLLQASGELDRRADATGWQAPAPYLSSPGGQGCPNIYLGLVNNYRVNQDCGFRRQAEEVVVTDPNGQADTLIAMQNDSVIGFNHCGFDWSHDGGHTWGSGVPPFYQYQLPDGHVADACSDPTISYDANHNAYIGGILFHASLPPNAVVVSKANSGINGEFFHTPNSTLSFQTYRANPLGVIAATTDPNIFNDKEFLIADSNLGSPKANNVYFTWTRFNSATGQGVGANSPINFSQSTDGGTTWSTGVEISGANAAFCTQDSGELDPNACDQDQSSEPIVGPDGTLYVAFINFNTAVNPQSMIVSCSGLADCTNAANWSAPVHIEDAFNTQPVGPNATSGCPSGRRCLPPNGYRLSNLVLSMSIDNAGRLYAVWDDFRNGGAPCTGPASTATPPCDEDVFYAYSTDAGATWSAAINVTPAATFGATAQWQGWSQVTADGKRLLIAYYDRSYGCEFTGCNDITSAKVVNPASGAPVISYKRLTTSSMPNLVPANNPLQAGFLGDYMWLHIHPSGSAYVVWADTRGRLGAVEEDIYIARNP